MADKENYERVERPIKKAFLYAQKASEAKGKVGVGLAAVGTIALGFLVKNKTEESSTEADSTFKKDV